MTSSQTDAANSLSSGHMRVSKLRGDILAVSLVSHLLGLALPLAMLQIYDRILPSQSFGTATFLVGGVAVAIILDAILRYGRQALFANLGAGYEARATIAALNRLQHADIEAAEARGTAAVSDALRAIGQVRDFWSGQAGVALYEVPFVVIYIALIAYIGGWLAVIPICLFAASLAFAAIWNKRIVRAAGDVEQLSDQRRDFTWSMFGALDYLKAIGSEASLASMWRRINARYMLRSAELEVRMSWIRENATAISQLSTALIVAFGAINVINGNMTTGMLAACTMLAGRSIGPAMASLGHWSQLSRVREAEARVNDLLDLPLNTALAPNATHAGPKIEQGSIEINAPSFLEKPLEIKAGEIVHLNAPDAPITSQLMSAIAGLSNDDDIEVSVGGHALSEYASADYREAVMLVAGSLALVPGTILNNLTLYDPRYNADVRTFSEALGLQEYVDKLRNGILTEVGPGTAEHLDEGIYQRIAIIRALVRKPRILLLDHAASGIDLDGIKRLAEVLDGLRGQTTVLVATYDETLLGACDRSVDLSKIGAGK